MYSEQEMKDFFQGVVDQVATLSTQASRVDGLEQRILVMSDKLRQLEETNSQLQRDLAQANDTIRDTQAKLEQSFRDFDNERAVSNSLREIAVQRDHKVQELEVNNAAERDAHRVTTSERDDARRYAQEQESQANSFRLQYEEVKGDRDHWREKANEYERQAADYKQQLDKINSLLNPTVVSRDFQVVG